MSAHDQTPESPIEPPRSLAAMPCCLSSFLDRVICGDNCETLAAMPAESVDLVVTSPPYDNLRTYGGHSWDFEGVARELTRVLKPGGVIVWVVADATINGSETLTSMRQAIHFKEVCGLRVHDTMIYKTNKPPQNGNRYEPCWEYMFVFSKDAPKTWNAQREKSIAPGVIHSGGMRGEDGQMRERSYNNRTGETKVRENIWYLPRSPHSDGKERHGHPATYPMDLARLHILSWSNEGDVVLDPFAGSGTTCVAAKELNRRFIGIEINPEYVEICTRRIAQDVLALDFRKPCPRCGYCGFIEDADMNLAGVCPECHGESAKFYSDNTPDQERKSPASDGSI